MKYCTNCGCESSKKVCHSCGVKRNVTHKFCAYCGAELADKAAICTNCKEKTKGEPFFWNLLNVLAAVALAAQVILSVSTAQPAFVILLYLLAALLCLPVVKPLIRRITVGKKAVRSLLKTLRIVAIVVLFALGMDHLVVQEPEITVYHNEATAAAEVVFHEEVQLKNEASYVLNDSDVTWETTPYKGVEGSRWRLVFVELDYSAQNGFGGTNRETYRVEMLFDITDGTYHRKENARLIVYDIAE